jgi:tripeptide aminopeptidase
MNGAATHSAVSRVSQLASLPGVHAAFQWFHRQERQVMQWQHDLVSIAAPPFGEAQRAEWLRERFRELKLEQVEIDTEGNVLGWRRAPTPAPCVVLSAHIDTVFPREIPIEPELDHHRLTAPGACDNGAGVCSLLAMSEKKGKATCGECAICIAPSPGGMASPPTWCWTARGTTSW